MNYCRHRHRDDRHRVAGPELLGTLPDASLPVTWCWCLKDSQDSMHAGPIFIEILPKK